MDFRWNDWNEEHATRHGVTIEEAEEVAQAARRPWPEAHPDDKWLVWGRSQSGRMIQVVYLLDPDGTLFVIHARPLNAREKSGYKRRN